MKKVVMLVLVLALLVPAGAAFADPGSSPNSETFNVTCEGFEPMQVVVTGSAGHTDLGIGIARTLYINGEQVVSNPGRGYETVWCEWSVAGDPNQYSGDIQVAPPGGR